MHDIFKAFTSSTYKRLERKGENTKYTVDNASSQEARKNLSIGISVE
jgi:hypothetical protein